MVEKNPADVRLDQIELKLGSADFHFDCQFPSGRLTAVVGPSGSGKSTLLNIISGFERPQKGWVLISEEDVTHLSPSQRPVSLVFQDNNLFSHLDLFTNIGLGVHPGMKLAKTDHKTILDALARVGLGGQEKRLPGSLSGGERQRAAFARALVRQRPVLLLDEPFAALDPGLRASMVDLLAELHTETRATVLLVTHDPRDIEKLADQVVFLDQGKVLVAAPASEFLKRDDLPILREFLGKTNDRALSP